MSATPAKKNSPEASTAAEPSRAAPEPGRALEICIVSPEFIGPTAHGSAGLAYTAMAQALTTAGHKVTCLFLGPKNPSNREWERWVEKYRADGLTLKALPAIHASALMGPPNLIKSYEAYQWLKKNDRFDIIHFPELHGPGYHTLTAKHHGLAFKQAMICVGIHKLTAWLQGTEAKPADPLREVDTEFMERKAVALADAVVGPNQNLVHWISDHKSAGQTGANQTVRLPAPAQPADSEAAQNRSEINEFVYFGALDAPRGLNLFCDALDLISPAAVHKLRTVTFLGTEGIIDGLPAQNFIDKRARHWPFAVQFVADLHETGTMNYLRQKNRVAVIPSLVEGSPYRVLECLVAGVAFVASRVGTIPKLITAEDADKVCFDPNPKDLCAMLNGCLTRGIRPARSAGDARKSDLSESMEAQAQDAIHALSVDPANVAALKILAQMHLNSGLHEAAQEACQWILKVHANDAEALQILEDAAKRAKKRSSQAVYPMWEEVEEPHRSPALRQTNGQ